MYYRYTPLFEKDPETLATVKWEGVEANTPNCTNGVEWIYNVSTKKTCPIVTFPYKHSNTL